MAEALEAEGPVVALETTIVTHGMPFPQNLETAGRVEGIIRAKVGKEIYFLSHVYPV